MVSLHVPLTPDTKNLIDADALALMRPDAALVNCGRGGLVDLGALRAALESGRLAGAALDVLDTEPPPPDHLAFTLPRTIITRTRRGCHRNRSTPHMRWRRRRSPPCCPAALRCTRSKSRNNTPFIPNGPGRL